MKRQIILTGDGSHTVSVPEMKVTYHSIHGAIQESMHVFIEAGLSCVRPLDGEAQNTKSPEAAGRINIFEMGLGTGLNGLLTLIESDKLKQPIHYTAIELSPLNKEEVAQLNYCEQLNQSPCQIFMERLHQCEWEKDIAITPYFTFFKTKCDLANYPIAIGPTDQLFNLIYYDAFAPNAQPELWTQEIFEKLYSMMSPGGILVTYCSKGDVRRAMRAAGFIVEKIPGPPKKREMLRARK